MGFYLDAEKGCKIRLLEAETEAVKIAAKNLKQDLIKVFGGGFEVNVEDAAGQEVQTEGKMNSTAGRRNRKWKIRWEQDCDSHAACPFAMGGSTAESS